MMHPDHYQQGKIHSWLPFWTLLRREILRFWRVSSQTLLTPIITAT